MSEPQFEPVRKFVRAGAGAGKTWNLTRQVVALALEHRQQTGVWPKTVLTTFTVKATQELKERLLAYCLEEKPEALEFVQSKSFLNITTMHGLFSMFLSRYGYALQLPSAIKVVDAGTADFWRKQILKSLIAERQNFSKLNFFDFKRLLSYLKLYEEVFWSGESQAISSNQQLEQLFASMANNFADQLQDIITGIQAEVDHDKWTEYCGSLKKLEDTYRASMTWSDKRQMGQEILSGLLKPRKSKNTPGLSASLDKKLTDHIKLAKKWWIEPVYDSACWPDLIETLGEFNAFAEVFMKRLFDKKCQEASLEPNDLEFFSLSLLNQKPEVVDRFSQDVDAWFIDEFQDTSPLQLKILDRMIADNSCYMVGDPQQSIYLFRGSRSEVFFNKQNQMHEQSAKIDVLEDNYRSQAHLLNFFNCFFTSLSQNFSGMNPMVEEMNGESSVLLTEITQGEEQELSYITAELNKLFDAGVNPKDIAILTRTHSGLEKLQKLLLSQGFPVISHASSSYFQRREVQDAMAMAKFLLNPWDNVNLVLLLRSPWVALDDQKIVEIINSEKAEKYWPFFKNWFQENQDFEPGQLFLEAYKQQYQFGVAWSFRSLVLRSGLLEYSQKIDNSGRREANLWKLINIVEKVARDPDLNLLELISQGLKTTSLEELGDSGDATSALEPNKINLMTIHASKGLQFDHVFLPFLHKKPNDTKFGEFNVLEDSKLWSMRMPLLKHNEFVGDVLEYLKVSEMKKRESQEYLRVLYVAMTRAKNRLFLSWTGIPHKQSWGAVIDQHWIDQDDRYQRRQITNIDAQACHISVEQTRPRAPYDASVIDWPQPEKTSSSEVAASSWQQLKESHRPRQYGVILHRLFESLKLHSPEIVKSLSKDWLPSESQAFEQALEFVLQNQEVPFGEIIANGFVEWGYQQEDQTGLKERRIDLWGIVADTLWIVDYKTGSSKYKDKAFEQMSEYAEALKPYKSWQGAIKLVAAYPFSQEVFIKEF